MNAPLPSHESERLMALRRYDVLGSPPEKAFDEITSLAAHICRCPIALVSFIDRDRQWFKSRVGLDGVETTPRDLAFCAHTILHDDVLVVEDATRDARFADHPMVTGGPRVRFYAGAPLVDKDGFGLGSLCVVDHAPRQLSDGQLAALKALGRQVVLLLELRRADKELCGLNNALESRVAERTAQLDAANRRLLAEIADKERIQDQMVQIQKMEAVGRLAGGVAHDFNNILVVVNCYTQMLLEQPGLAPSHLEAVSEIQKAAKRATALTRQLLTFSRRNVSAPKVTDLNDTVQNMSGMLQRLIREDIVLDLKKAPKVYAVSVDESQIEQVIMNLVINAGDAMPKGGRVALSTSTTVLSQPLAYDGGEIEPNRYTVITVQDNGTGMTAEVRAKIYEPFFTTKPAGHGTGLGLATCLGIVQQCRGYILCESETGRGTTFRVYIPAVDKETGLMKSGRVAVASPRGHETILLVEDDAAVRQITGLMLRKLGYTVIEAGDGLHALALMQSKTTLGVDLVLTDAVMPNLNGRELIDRLVELRPELKFILMSGYTEDAEVLGGGPHVTFLQKPIAIDQLSRRVRETLDARPLAA